MSAAAIDSKPATARRGIMDPLTPLGAPETRDNYFDLGIMLSGANGGIYDGKPYVHETGQLGISWHIFPTAVRWIRPNTEYCQVLLSPEWMLNAGHPPSLIARLSQGQTLWFPENGLGIDPAKLMLLWHEEMTSGSSTRYEIALRDITTQLHRLAYWYDTHPELTDPAQKSDSSEPAPQPGALRHAERMAIYISQHYQEPLTVKDISEAVKLHPNHAVRVFRQTLNQSMFDFVTHHRLAHAQRLLMTTDRTVLDIAMESGFGTLSRFYLVFQKACHMTPRRYRLAHRQRPARDNGTARKARPPH